MKSAALDNTSCERMKPDTAPSAAATLARLSDQVTTALRAVLGSPRLKGLGPIEVSRVLGVDKTLASRLMAALRCTDPMAALRALPGTVPLRRLVSAARELGVSAAATGAAERELRHFELE